MITPIKTVIKVPDEVFEILVNQEGENWYTAIISKSMGRQKSMAMGKPLNIFTGKVFSLSRSFFQRTMNCFSFSVNILQN